MSVLLSAAGGRSALAGSPRAVSASSSAASRTIDRWAADETQHLLTRRVNVTPFNVTRSFLLMAQRVFVQRASIRGRIRAAIRHSAERRRSVTAP
jgi:hypothetical protein